MEEKEMEEKEMEEKEMEMKEKEMEKENEKEREEEGQLPFRMSKPPFFNQHGFICTCCFINK